MVDDERRAEIEAVARALHFRYDDSSPRIRAKWDTEAEKAIDALDRVRDARGDDEARPRGTARAVEAVRTGGMSERRAEPRSPQGEDRTTAEGELEGELRDDLPFPQSEDHEAAWRVVASMPHATYAVLKPVICALGGQIESAGVGGWLGKARKQSEPSFARPEQPPPDSLGGQPPAEPEAP